MCIDLLQVLCMYCKIRDIYHICLYYQNFLNYKRSQLQYILF